MCCIEASCAMKHTRLSSSSSKACGGACNGIAAEELQKLRLADRASPQRTLTSTPWPGKCFGKYLQLLRPLCEGETNDVDDRPAETTAWNCYHTVALCLSLRRPKSPNNAHWGFVWKTGLLRRTGSQNVMRENAARFLGWGRGKNCTTLQMRPLFVKKKRRKRIMWPCFWRQYIEASIISQERKREKMTMMGEF